MKKNCNSFKNRSQFNVHMSVFQGGFKKIEIIKKYIVLLRFYYFECPSTQSPNPLHVEERIYSLGSSWAGCRPNTNLLKN